MILHVLTKLVLFRSTTGAMTPIYASRLPLFCHDLPTLLVRKRFASPSSRAALRRRNEETRFRWDYASLAVEVGLFDRSDVVRHSLRAIRRRGESLLL